MATILPLTAPHARPIAPKGRSRVRLELTRRGRLLATGAAFLLGIAVAIAGFAVMGGPWAFASPAGDEMVVTVAPGDTLTEYAQDHAPEGITVEQYVQDVRLLNNLPTPRLTVGEQITLPEGSVQGE